jgi:hypothetical protein
MSTSRAKRRSRGDLNGEKLPVFTASRPSARNSRQRASLAPPSSFAVSPAPVSGDNSHIIAGLSARRTRKARAWGKATTDQQVEHTWNGIATQTRVTSLKPKEELELTTRLKKYFKLKDKYDALAKTLGYLPTMEEFSRRLGTDKVSTVSTIMSDGPKQKAAMVRHNMGLVVNIVNKYEHPDVTKEVRLMQHLRQITSRSLDRIQILCSCDFQQTRMFSLGFCKPSPADFSMSGSVISYRFDRFWGSGLQSASSLFISTRPPAP